MKKKWGLIAGVFLIIFMILIILVNFANAAKIDKVNNSDDNSDNKLIGGNEDENGCLIPAGYSWNESDGRCVKELVKKGKERYQYEIKEKKNITFIPWQKRNQSDCLEGCKCRGAVMSCQTETGKTITIEAGNSGKIIVIEVNKVNASTELSLEQESIQNKTKIKTKLKNGKNIEIKIMPDSASERALEVLKLKVCSAENNCTIEIKESGNDKII